MTELCVISHVVSKNPLLCFEESLRYIASVVLEMVIRAYSREVGLTFLCSAQDDVACATCDCDERQLGPIAESIKLSAREKLGNFACSLAWDEAPR
jgi:hypothetical protein